jgi:hypothetical protein
MRESRVALLAVFALCAGACSTNPDVVATGQTLQEAGPDGRFNTPDRNLCYPGLYKGEFNHSPSPDAQGTFAVSGSITFRLLETNSGEFSTVESGALSAKPNQGNRISADIDPGADGGGGGCYQGDFRVTLANGEYYPDDASGPIRFYGVVEGTYTGGAQRRFSGAWKAFLDKAVAELLGLKPPVLISEGQWVALWQPE